MKVEVITRYSPKTMKIKTGASEVKVQVAMHFGYWCFADCEVVPLEVWSGAIYHGAGLIDYAMRYFSGKIVSYLPPHPVGIDTAISGMENGSEWTVTYNDKAGAFVGNVILEPNTEYKFSLNRPPAPPDVEYPENPLLYYLTLSLVLPNDGWEVI